MTDQYIITKEQLLDTKSYIYHEDEVAFKRIYRVVLSNPYNPQAEREKVLELLNVLRRYANGEYNEAELLDNEHDMRIHLEYENRIWEIMIELRQEGKE